MHKALHPPGTPLAARHRQRPALVKAGGASSSIYTGTIMYLRNRTPVYAASGSRGVALESPSKSPISPALPSTARKMLARAVRGSSSGNLPRIKEREARGTQGARAWVNGVGVGDDFVGRSSRRAPGAAHTFP
jgi:hypothetical protein